MQAPSITEKVRLSDHTGRDLTHVGFARFLVAGLILCLAAICQPGCGGAKVLHIRTDPSFTYDEVSSASIMVAGVTSAVGDDDYRKEIRRGLTRLLAERIIKKRPSLTILDPRRVQQSIVEERYAELLDRYEATDRLDTAGMIELFDATRGLVRYMVFARVEMDSITRTVDEDEISIDRKTERLLKISFRIYDIAAGEVMYSTSILNQDYNLNVDVQDDTPDDECSSFLSLMACLLDFISWFEKDDDEGFPLPPKLDNLAKEVFDKFAENLPQAESG